MVPSAACAIRVIRELPDAWLKSQAYQKVTEMVARDSIGLLPKFGIIVSGRCQIVTPTAISAVAARGVRVRCRVGWAQPRKQDSSTSCAFNGFTMLMAIAIGIAYQMCSSGIDGTGDPRPIVRARAANFTARGTARATA